MPAVSKSQFALMKGCAEGGYCPPGMTPKEAAEYVGHQSPKGLPPAKGKGKAKPKKKGG